MKLAMVFPSLLLMSVFGMLIACATREGPEKAQAPGSKAPELSASARELLALLPEDNAIPGWTRNGEVRFFNPGNLWEYIDGAAEGYLTYGFEDVVTAEYNNPAKSSQAVIDVYRMKDARNAYGIYAAELNPESGFRRLGVEGYIGGTALNFWSGPYYVKITVFQESEDLKQEMVKLAERLSQKLGDPGGEPAEVKYFPREYQVPHSVRYLPKDVLGQSYLMEAFEARYRQLNTESKIVVASFKDSDQAKEALARYRQFIASSGEVRQDLTSPADGGFAGKDSFYGNMAAVRSGSRIIIALGGPSEDFALSHVKATLSSIR